MDGENETKRIRVTERERWRGRQEGKSGTRVKEMTMERRQSEGIKIA